MSNSNEQPKNSKDNTAGNTNKSSFSLAVKLNLHTVLYTFGVLLTVNILLCLAVSSFTLWKAEENASSLMTELSPKNETIMDFTFEPSAKDPRGIGLWRGIHELTPLKDYQVVRRVWFDTRNGLPLSALKYQMTFIDEKTSVTYSYGKVLEEYLDPLYALLIIEALLLLAGIVKGRRRVRRILQPLRKCQDRPRL